MTQFTFTPGVCMSCGEAISSGMFCSHCLRPETRTNSQNGSHLHNLSFDNGQITGIYLTNSSPNTQDIDWGQSLPGFLESTLALTLEKGKIGFVSRSDFYRDDKLIFILGSATVFLEKSKNNNIAIRKAANGSIEVLSQEIDRNDITQSLPGNSRTNIYLRVHFLSTFE